MRTVDVRHVAAPVAQVWPHAAQVERWPVILPHYRRVLRLEGVVGGDGVVEMAAVRPFGGPLLWPTWWASQVRLDHVHHTIRYRHIAGITRGMDVEWTLVPHPEGGTVVMIVHAWHGPSWPWIGGLAARLVIGPVFIHGIASRTLAGIARAAEAVP